MVRALHTAGPERTVVVQALKGGFAAACAWLLASQVLDLAQPFLAPYAAVFLVEATVFRSITSAVQQIASVVLGVALAAVAVLVIPSQVVALGVVVVIGLIAGSWHRFGVNNAWIAVTALLLVTYGTAGESVVLFDRLLATLLGAVIGLGINALLFPPTYGRKAAETTSALVAELSAVLREIAVQFRCDDVPERPQEWEHRVRNAEALVRAAETAADWSSESTKMNIRRSAPSIAETAGDWHRVLVAVRSAWPHIRELTEAVRMVTRQRTPFGYPDARARATLADLFDATAAVMTGRTDADSTATGQEEAVAAGRLALTDLERYVRREPDALHLTMGVGSILLPARKAFEALTGWPSVV